MLTDLKGLESVNSVERLSISTNARLASLRGLDNLSQLTTLDVETNRQLPACEVRAFFTRAGGQELTNTGNNNTATCN